MNYESLVKEYILSKKMAWARTTQKNELARLLKHGHNVLLTPDLVYSELNKSMKPYSVKVFRGIK